MNIDFGSNPGFSAYVLLLMFSGLVMLLLASPAVRESRRWLRVLNAAIGLGFFGYGFYLAFLFQGGSYFIFFKVFFVPVALIVRTVQASRAAKAEAARAAAAPQQQWPAAPGQQWAAPDGQQWAGAPQGQQWGAPAPAPQQQWGTPQQQWDAPQPQWQQPQPWAPPAPQWPQPEAGRNPQA